MKAIWNKYKWLIIVSLAVIMLFTGTSVYYRHKVFNLQKQLFDKEIERIMEIDRIKSQMITEQIRITDSILAVEQEKYTALLLQYSQTKKEYEKVYNDYSSIVIERPEF